jgi:pimeloyl-ACP methyl ester carboxylesterase
MWALRFRHFALCISTLAFLSMAVPAQNPSPQRPSAPAGTPAATDTDAEYRKLDTFLVGSRERKAKLYAIDPAKGIDEGMYVPIGGIDQWITIRGQDRRNPVLLFVHGGPGDVTNPWSYPYFAPWEERFTVVQWDERGAGRTLHKTGSSIAPTITVERMSQDGIELSEFLRKHLAKDKIILVSHSFGTLLALRMVQARPDLFYAYVGTGQVADETKNYAVAYTALLAKAQASGNQEARADLHRIGPPPYANGEGYGVQRKWANRFEGADRFLPGTIGLALTAPGYSVQDLLDSMDGQVLSAEQLVPQTKTATMKDLGLEFRLPVFFFQGSEDFTTPTALAKQYLEALQAPHKEFVPIAGGHFAVFMNSDEFLAELVARVLPLTNSQQTAIH